MAEPNYAREPNPFEASFAQPLAKTTTLPPLSHISPPIPTQPPSPWLQFASFPLSGGSMLPLPSPNQLTPNINLLQPTSPIPRLEMHSKPIERISPLQSSVKIKGETLPKYTREKSKSLTSSSDSDPKKQKSLERNRVAAQKCREKKKQWIHSLQIQMEYLSADNEALSSQTTALREEIFSLRTLLLAHKECEIARANGVNGLECVDEKWG